MLSWVQMFVLLLVSHLVGDYLLQTDWQALHKRGGLVSGDPQARRALVTHVCTYTIAFLPALLADKLDVQLLWAIPAIFVPHLIQDDGTLIARYMTAVKGLRPSENLPVAADVDQTFHVVALLLLAFALGK
ncbi:MAG TPA: DUF3307 domain-containing protein [Solirubrobacteraceae bacterium]|jgi:hypothetical protein|nr:DUF3307 domain-containing protein [Solirubrobacteraceae bacterium]